MAHIIKLSAGLVRGGNSGLAASAAAGGGWGAARAAPPVPVAEDVAPPELVGIDWAAKNIEDAWEQPVARRLHLNPSDLEQDETLVMPVRIPIGVSLQGDHDLDLELCQFDMAPYHRNPEKFPMSKDLVKHFCAGERRREHKLASALAEDAGAGKQLQPTGFVFHESRVGSTLVANMLASVPTNLVFSEPAVPAMILHACEKAGCTEDVTVRLLRMGILAMGRSHHHDHFFIKFSSSMVNNMDLVLKAFPETPWTFIYRDPVEVMVSNLNKPNGPCVRSIHHAPPAVQRVLGSANAREASRVGEENYCAAHLTVLCEAALQAVNAQGSKGYAVPYETLVKDTIHAIVPGHFGVAMNAEETERMTAQSELYSKARKGDTDFEGDTEQKQEAASEATKAAAAKYLQGPTEQLRQVSAQGRRRLEANAELRAQEALVYERTGSRFFQLPHCPDEPEYPPEVPIVDMVANWNPDDIAIPERHYNTLCRIDYQKDYEKALRYRDAEVPFITYNIPAFEETVAKWNRPGYLTERLGDKKFHTEISKDNHFMYYRLNRKKSMPKGYVPPTTSAKWTYDQWLYQAREARNISTEEEHYYFRVSDSDDAVVTEDVTIFNKDKPSLFMKEPRESRGIHCRFGMRGVIAEAHFDASRNMVGLVSGTRRWILAQPAQCKHAYLLPTGHPSGRHSEVDWSKPDLEAYPDFANMVGHEVLLTPGDVLNVPAWWIHFIENLDINTQCNSRSGDSEIGLDGLDACGFHMKVKRSSRR